MKEYIKRISNDSNLDLDNFTLEYIRLIDSYIFYNTKKDTGIKTYTCSKEMAKLTTYSTKDNSIGPIMIIRGVLNNEDVYLVICGGTEFVNNQATGIKADVLSAFELNNDYLFSVRDTILNQIPIGSNLFIIGSSLGGMIAQQTASLRSIKNYYNIISVVTFGSPLISPSKRDCTVKRLCDKKDIVPLLSLSTFSFNSKYYDEFEKYVEDGGYSNFIDAHKYSYLENPVWDKYDVLGIKYGNNSITLDMDNIKYFDALKK